MPTVVFSIPHILDVPRFEEKKIILERNQKGIPLKIYIQEHQYQSIQRLTNWLIDLNFHTQQQIVLTPQWMDRNILQPLNNLKSVYGETIKITDESVDYIRSIIHSFAGKSLSLCRTHNNLQVNKVTVLTGDEIYITDWELSEDTGYPLIDLLSFITDAISLQYNMSFNKSVEYIQTGKISTEYNEAIQYYLKKINMDNSWMPLLFLLFGLNRVNLTRKIIYPIQTFDGLDWARNPSVLMNNIIRLLGNNPI